MAQWNTNVKHEPSSINNGNQYEKKDRVSREQLNALAENSFYAMEKSDDAVSKSEQAVETANEAFEQSKVTGTQIYSDGEFQKTFNMKQATADFAESERQKSLGEDGAIVHANEVYPIGSIYMSVNETSPASFFGGTWERLKDKFLLGAGDTYSNGATGGQAQHNHGLSNGYARIGQRAYSPDLLWLKPSKWSYESGTIHEFNVGSGNGYDVENVSWDIVSTSLGGTTDNANNMPPYLTVYMWKRVG